MSTEGKIPLQADLIPNNDNPRGFVTRNKYVKGAPQVFKNIQELVEFHPMRMEGGMPASVLNYPTVGVISDFRLMVDPSQMMDSSKNSIVTLDNFTEFWQLQTSTETSKSRVYQYSADGPGGGSPVYPYVAEEESKWENTFDASRGHRWMRFRDDDVDANEDGIYDNWTTPIPVNSAYSPDDFLDNRYRRQAVSSTQHLNSATLIADKYYVVETGQITITGDLSLNDIGAYSDTQTTATLGAGRRFKFVSGNSYDFINAAIVTETIKPPPRSVNGLPNNEPVGWEDEIPSGTDQLWEITGQKSVYGQLKSDWLLRKIVENPNYVRYSNRPTPHPDTIAGVNTSANSGSPEDLTLIAEGWESVYQGQSFIATREDSPGPDLYTNWLVRKINEESGEYTDQVFKLFDLNLDTDSPALVPPTLRDPSSQGWHDTPLPETDTKINYVSKARKFFNGELKTPWSQPVPYTGKDSFSDVIDSDLGDNFKYDQNGNVMPSAITLKALLYKGVSELWQNPELTITYEWKKVYDDGSAVDISPTTNPADDFYLLPVSGSPGEAAYARNNQRVVVKPGAVHGDAVFRCIQTLVMSEGDDLVFEDEFSILDVTDGKDAKVLSVRVDNGRVIYDNINLIFVPQNIVIRVYSSNIPSPTYYWYKWNGTSWDALSNGVDGYSIGGNTLSVASDDVFTDDDSSQEQRYAVSTHATDPNAADFQNTFSDYVTIVKLAASSTGIPGENSVAGLLTNESHTVVLNSATGSPIAGEISASGRAKTILQVYDGNTKKVFNSDYTIALSSDNGNVSFDSSASGNDVEIYVSSWGANQRSAVCTITITYGLFIFTKQFSVSSTKDAPGAVLLDIDSNKGFTFTPSDKTDKLLTAKLYDTGLTGTQEISLPDATHTFRWNVAGVWSSQSANNTRTITRSDILVTGQVTVEVYKDAVLFRSRTITIADVNDGRSYRAWTDNPTKPASNQRLTTQSPINGGIWPVTVNGVVWRLPSDSHWNSNSPTFAQDASEDTGSWSWTPVYQIKGEKGDQGIQGGFIFPMYIASDSTPSLGSGGSSSTLSQMLTAGWTSKPPVSGRIWRAERLWTSQGVTFNANGDPSTPPVTGSTWNGPIPVSGTNGLNGTNGSTGPTGPGYNGVTFQGLDGSGNAIYSLNPVNGASPASFLSPRGPQGASGSNISGGNAYSNGLSYTTVSSVPSAFNIGASSSIDFAQGTAVLMMPQQASWKPRVGFTVGLKSGNGSTTADHQVALYILANGSVIYGVEIRVGGSWCFVPVETIHAGAAASTQYTYAVRVQNISNNTNLICWRPSMYNVFLVPSI
jgi:hypothetical protein